MCSISCGVGKWRKSFCRNGSVEKRSSESIGVWDGRSKADEILGCLLSIAV